MQILATVPTSEALQRRLKLLEQTQALLLRCNKDATDGSSIAPSSLVKEGQEGENHRYEGRPLSEQRSHRHHKHRANHSS